MGNAIASWQIEPQYAWKYANQLPAIRRLSTYVTLRVLVVRLQKRKQPGDHVEILDHCQRLWVWNHMARRRPGWHKLFKVVDPGSSSMLRQRLPVVNIVIAE